MNRFTSYRVALLFLPRGVRERFGREMEAGYARLVNRAVRHGRVAAVVAMVRGHADAVVSGLRMRVRPSLRRALLNEARTVPVAAPARRMDMGALFSDVKFAFRSIARQPAFALTAVVTLGLGIGANTAIFGVVYSLLLRPLPYPEGDRLVMAWSANPERGWQRTDVSLADAADWHARTNAFEDLALIGRASLNVTGGDVPERVEAKRVTSNIFRVLGTAPVIGRDFEEADDRPGAPGVAVLTWGFWQRHFGGDRSALGSVLQLDDEPYTVVGIQPQGFTFPDDDSEIFVPLRLVPSEQPRTGHGSTAIGRLRPGITVEQASRDVAAAAAALAAEFPETNEGWTAYVVSLRDDLVTDTGRQASMVLMAAVAFVLLMSCVNVANLMLARANARRRELAVRAALGARRFRMIRQLLTESLVLALGGAFAGLGLAWVGVRLISASMPPNLSPVFEFRVDTAVFLFALAMSVVAALLFGILPALRGSSASGTELREEGRIGEGRRSKRFGGTLVVVQTSLAVVLLTGGGIMMRNVAQIHRQDLGFDMNGVLTARVTPPSSKYPDAASLERFYSDVLRRIRSVAGVDAAGTIQSLPLRGSNNINEFRVEGEAGPAGDGHPARMGYLSTGYLDAMSIALRRGRDFADGDREGAPRVALVNETLVRQRFGDSDPIGRQLRVDGEAWTIIGIVDDMLERALQRPPEPSIYLPVSQTPVRSRSFAIRTSGDPVALAGALERIVAAVDPDQPIYEVQPMRAIFDMRISPFRMIAGLMLAFAIVSLLLGAVGIYGVTSYAVGRRTNEIGIRMAIGAARGSVVRMIVREGLVRAALGIVIGLALAVPLARAMRGLLVGISPNDPLTFTTVVLVLAFVTFLGAWIPARRAARLDPLRALARE